MKTQYCTLFFRSLGTVILVCCTLFATAQNRYKYLGFEANFGVKSAHLTSNIPQINAMAINQEGGSLGLVFGNVWLKSRLQAAGFYYSSSSVPQTVNLVESALILNVYPISLITREFCALNPYISGGVDHSSLKFFGYYNNADAKYNYSSSRAPYIGQMLLTRGAIATGLEWRLKRESDFIHIFAEARYSFQGSSDPDTFFADTKLSNTTSVNLGVSFGFLK